MIGGEGGANEPGAARDRKRSRRIAAGVLCLLCCILIWPVVFSAQGRLGDAATNIKYPTSEMGDQRQYHEPTILTFAEQWPSVDLINYPSATSPGYHLVIAVVARYISHDLVVLQFVSSLLLAHLAVSTGLALWTWQTARDQADLRFLLLLAMTTAVAGPIGAAGTLGTIGLWVLYSRTAIPFEQWYEALFPEKKTPFGAHLFEQVSSERELYPRVSGQ